MRNKIIQPSLLKLLSIDELITLYRQGYKLESTASTVASTTLTGCSSKHAIGDSCSITAVCKDSSGTVITCPTITWTSSDPTKVSVESTTNNKGHCHLLALGSSKITATIGSVSSSKTINVTSVNPLVLIGCSSTRSIGSKCTITAVCMDTSGAIITCPTIVWTSSNPTIASILSNSKNTASITALSPGTVTITASDGTHTTTKIVTVSTLLKKYKCINNVCTEDPSGTFTEPTCNKTCLTPKYKCINNVCTEDPTGTFDEPTCNNSCIPVPKYKCNTEGICTRDDINGTFITSDCDKTCNPPKKYKCINGVCTKDPTGTFTEPTCNNECIIPKYKCSNGECIRDDINGTYTSSNCNNECVITPKYKCVDNNCVRDDINGTFTEPTCNDTCVTRYKCINGVCTEDPTGNYTEPTCHDTCIIPKYKCNSNGKCIRDDTNGTFTTDNCDNTCVKPSNNTSILLVIGAGVGLLYIFSRK